MTYIPESRNLRAVAPKAGCFRVMMLALAVLPLAGSSQAATIVTVSGSGDLTIESDGAVYFDFAQLSLTNLELTADNSITLSTTAYPASAPTTFDSTELYADLVGAQVLSFGAQSGDVLFGSLDWSGDLTVIAPDIYGIGEVVVNGTVMFSAGATTGGSGECPPGTSPAGSLIIIGTDLADSGTPLCAPEDITGGSGIIVPISGVIITGPIPEPNSALLFVAGFALVLGRRTLMRAGGNR